MVIMPIYNFLYVLFPEWTIIFTIIIMMFQVRKASEPTVGHVCLTSLYLRTANRCSASTSIWSLAIGHASGDAYAAAK